ncbi:MAG: class I SAM-dependent methyltransferase [Microthrixaceae bacterium]|nr:class I SAM-dependent methyltransferase [Microthrixaceae bacterium]
MSAPKDPPRPIRRHPSAGNLGMRPALIEEAASAEQPPLVGFPAGAEDGPALALGPGLDPDLADRLIGSTDGKRILELGTGTGRVGVELAGRGAKVICVEPSIERVTDARAIADAAKVKVEYHHGDLADLAFVRGDQIDLALAVYSLASVDDLGRVFRQVNRVLRSEASLIVSLPHPLSLIAEISDGGPRLTRTYFDSSPIRWQLDGEVGTVHPHSVGEVITTLWRSNFRVDTVLEPAPTANTDLLGEWVPTSLVIRARKQGV